MGGVLDAIAVIEHIIMTSSVASPKIWEGLIF